MIVCKSDLRLSSLSVRSQRCVQAHSILASLHYLHNNTLRVTASQSSYRPIRGRRGQASPTSAELSLVETQLPGGGGCEGMLVVVAWAHYWLLVSTIHY